MARSEFGYDTSKYDDNRRNFKLEKDDRFEIEDSIKEVILTDADIIAINNKIKENLITDYRNRKTNRVILKEDFIKLSYIMRFKLKLPALHMASYLGVQNNSFFKKMKSLGWTYTTSESQQIASEKSRDYSQIRVKSKKTRLENFGASCTEDKTREYLNLNLTERLPNCEVIVGSNNLSILYNICREIDIPIIIIKDSKIYKFAIEVNGNYWHLDEERDKIKNKALKDKGYKHFILWQCSTNEQRENIGVTGYDDELSIMINKIVKSIK